MEPSKASSEAARRRSLKDIKIDSGKHSSLKAGGCVMELVSYLADEPWSDHPECTCPALTAYAISVNDRSDDTERQKLRPFIPRLINTRDGNQKSRAEFFVLSCITRTLPLLIDALELPGVSAKLRAFKLGEWIEAREYINEQKSAIREAARKHASAAAAYAASAASAASAAASAASAASAAASAAEAAAYAAAYAAPEMVAKWKNVRREIISERLKILDEAIEIGKKVSS